MLVDEIAKNMQMGKQTDLILLDFRKAFDKVAHKKLISKLHFYGIRGKTLSWVKAFLDSCDYQHTSSVTQMIKDINWRTLEQRRIDSRLTHMYKITYDLTI